MKALLTALAASVALATPAAAKDALWGRVGNWEIRGDTNGVCYARTAYTSGHQMLIMFGPDDSAALSILNVPAVDGRTYQIGVLTDDGNFGTFEGVGVSGAAILFNNLNRSAIRSLANAKNVLLQDIGTFSLKGSRKAMAEAWTCMETLNSF